MAQGTGSTFASVQVQLGDGGTPTEIFTAVCGVMQKDIDYSSDIVETEIPDCADESLPSYKNAGIKAVMIKVSCSGKWTKESHGTLITWWKTSTPKNIKLRYVTAATGDIEYINGPAILGNLKHSVSKGAYMDGSFDIMFAAQPAFVNKP